MSIRDLTFLRVNYLAGPNQWTYRSVIEAWVDIGAYEDLPTNLLPGFASRLANELPGLAEHRCGVGERGGFVQRLHEGTWLGHVLEHVAIELQNRAGMPCGFGKARETSQRGIYKVVFRTREERVGRAALEAARRVVLAVAENAVIDVAGEIAALADRVDRHHLGPSTAAIVLAAAEAGVPAIRLNDGNLVQLGYGRRQRRLWTAETELTSAIAEGIASDKALTKSLLSACGVPVPGGSVVASAEAAWETAEDIGLPVVVKPLDGNHGRGVSLNLRTREEVAAAFALAEQEGSEVLVERFVAGAEHRALIVGDRLVAMASGEEAWVEGNGIDSVEGLIDLQLNSDPRRGSTEEFPLNCIDLAEDPAVVLELARQGLTPVDVPALGQKVLVQRNGNVANDVTDRVHPEVAAVLVRAARVVGLDVAGVDVVAEDISRPFEAQQAAVVEVNAGPGLLMHLKPASGVAQPVGEAIVQHLMGKESGRIPIVGVSGLTGQDRVAGWVDQLLSFGGEWVGRADASGVFLGGRQITTHAQWAAAQRVLVSRRVSAAVFATSTEQILTEGLPYDRCAVGVVLSLADAPDNETHDVRTEEQWRTVMRTQVDVVLPEGAAVLNAEDPAVLGLADLCDGEVVLFAGQTSTPGISAHLAVGGRAVSVLNEQVVLQVGVRRLAELTMPEAIAPEFRGWLCAAVAAAWAAGCPLDALAVGLPTLRLGNEACDLVNRDTP